MDVHVFRGNFGRDHEPSPKYCAAAVPDGGRSVSFHQCGHKPKVKRTVKGKEYGFCAIHDPVVVDRRRKERHVKYDAASAARTAAWARADQLDKAKNAALAALELIRDGHNDPRSLARETLNMLPVDHNIGGEND